MQKEMIFLINFKEELDKVGLSEEEYEECLKDINAKCSGAVDIDWNEIKEKYNIPFTIDAIRKSCSSKPFGSYFVTEYLANKGKKQLGINHKDTCSINKDGSYTSEKVIELDENDLKSPKKILEAHGYDSLKWELISAKNSVWNVYSKQDGIQNLYSSKITVKPISGISLAEITDFYKSLINEYSSPTVKKYETVGDLMLELNICDLHFGKFSSKEVSGTEYNCDIARECFNKVIDQTISRCKDMDISKIIFPIGNDLLNFDNAFGSTTEGTQQDNDGDHRIIFKNVVTMLIDGITKLSNELKTEVDVFCIQGNHDFSSSYHVLMSLWCYFNNNENVIVDTDPSSRKYRQWGTNLIGFAHGDKEKKRIAGLMAIEEPKKWSETTYREWHLGHLHSIQTREENGVIIRNLPSVTGTDNWHFKSGFVGSIRQCICFIWNKNKGLDSTFNVII